MVEGRNGNHGVPLKLIHRDRIPDPDSAGDWLRRMGDPDQGQAGLLELGRVRDEIMGRILRRDGIAEYTLDADATFLEGEKRDAQMSYKGMPGYMPMLGFLFEAKVCLLDEFREGNISPGSGQLSFYLECKKRMPIGKRIGFYRADLACYQADLINALEEDPVKWAITADQDSAVKRVIRGIEEAEWRGPVVGCGYQIAESVHTMNGTKKAFRLIVKRWERPQRDLFEGQAEPYAYHAVASNWGEEQKSTAAVLAWHNQRGEAENFNKELKCGFGMEQMPCGESFANDLREMVEGGTETTPSSLGSA